MSIVDAIGNNAVVPLRRVVPTRVARSLVKLESAPALVDEILAVSTDDAEATARRLAREDAIFAGTSSGANVVAAIRVAERMGPDATVVTLVVDSGLKYLSTDVYRR